MLDKIDAHQHEKELKVQEKLKASERKLEKAKKVQPGVRPRALEGRQVPPRARVHLLFEDAQDDQLSY